MIDASTSLYCVLGSPVSHSKSPCIHNRAFQDNGIDAVYLAFEPDDIGRAVRAIRTLSIKGASVTIPFKEAVMEHLDWIDPLAGKIGAVNTVVNAAGVLKGYNTDCRAAVAPLTAYGIEGKTVCIVGAGGAARAVAFGIAEERGRLIITNRNREKGLDLADRTGGEFVPYADMAGIRADIVINTTSVGMVPNDKDLSFPADALDPSMVVMDVVYTPLNTRLLDTARGKGCETIDGLAMFLAQAAAQFRLWTDIEPDVEPLREAVLDTQRRT